MHTSAVGADLFLCTQGNVIVCLMKGLRQWCTSLQIACCWKNLKPVSFAEWTKEMNLRKIWYWNWGIKTVGKAIARYNCANICTIHTIYFLHFFLVQLNALNNSSSQSCTFSLYSQKISFWHCCCSLLHHFSFLGLKRWKHVKKQKLTYHPVGIRSKWGEENYT